MLTMLNPFRLVDMFRGEAPKQPAKRRGLYYPPEGGEVYASHREWAGAQPFATLGIVALAQWVINPSVHHCRIGKITLKQAS